ncbi:MAG: TonB family C-terminal protein [Mucilaginibacter sp.]|nr:TonB family C-terminal protein [Mucilaginibacter sp.]
MNLLYYLAEANIYLGVFYLAYCLLLSKETYYQLTRTYLLFSCAVAFTLPVLQVGVLKPVEVAVTSTINYTVPAYTEPLITNYVNTAPVVVEHHLTIQDYMVYAYFLGACILFLMLVVKLFSLLKMMRNAQTVNELKYKVVYLPKTGVAFSFFNYLFIGDNAPGANTIIRHELVHIRQKHSFDIIFLEVLKVINWFNPFVYLLQNSLKTVHEYIADEQTAALEADALAYATFLVNNAYGTDGPAFTHSFFNYNMLKKRIVMLNRRRSGRIARLKYLVVLPLFAGLLCVSTLAFSKTYGWVDLDPAKPVKTDVNKISHSLIKASQVRDQLTIHPKPDKIVSATAPDISYVITPQTEIFHLKEINDGLNKQGFKLGLNAKMHEQEILAIRLTIETSPQLNWHQKVSAFFTMDDLKKTGDVIVIAASKTQKKLLLYIAKATSVNPSKLSSLDLKAYNISAPNKLSINDKDPHSGTVTTIGIHNATLDLNKDGVKHPRPLFFIDGEKFVFSKTQEAQLSAGALISTTADSMVTYPTGNTYAVAKWGKEAENKNVILLFGNASINVVDTVAKPDWLVKYFAGNVKYPATDRAQHVAGRVITIFAVDADHNLQYAKVVRTPSDAMGDEIVRVLKKCTELYMLKPGIQYTLPISYTLDDGNGGDVLPITQKLPKVHDPNSGVYNPNSMDIDNLPTGLVLNEIVIRGYIKKK